MEQVAGTARLVDPAAVDAEGTLTATLPRSEFEMALQDPAGADLYLEIARIQNGERNDRRICVAWERADLEKLLADSVGDSVSIALDAGELERMLSDPDFEAHGLKEKMAVITVALAAAGAAAGGAAAMTSSEGGAGTVPAAAVTMVTDNTSAGVPGAVSGLVTDASTGGVAAPAAAPAGTSFVTDNTSGGEPGAVSGFVTDGSTSGDTGSVTSFITDTGSDATRNAPAEPSGGGSFSVPDSAIGGVALAGGIALLITGAALAGRSRRGSAQPA